MRAVIVATAVAFVLSLFGTPLAVWVLRRLKAGQPIRDELGLASNNSKHGTPTMGGLAFILATLIAYGAGHVALISLPEAQLGQVRPTVTGLVLLGVFALCGLVGFIDDYLKVVAKNPAGLSAKGKLLGQVLVGATFGVVAMYFPSSNGATVASTKVSFVKDISWLDISKVGAVLLFVLIVVFMSNAVNLTDGMDGLATGASV